MKLGERTCDIISAAALALFAAVLIGMWLYQVATHFHAMEESHQRSVESKADARVR